MMNETSGQSSYSIGGNKQFESPEWVVMKSVIDSQAQLTRVLEQQALYTCRDEPELEAEEIQRLLEEARRRHEQALENIDLALQAVSDEN